MLYNFKVELNKNDLYEGQINHFKNTPLTKEEKTMSIVFLTIPVIFIVNLLFIYFGLQNTFYSLIFIIPIVICSVISAPFIFVFTSRTKIYINSKKKSVKKEVDKADMPISAKMELQFYEDFVFIATEQIEEKLKYSALTKLDSDKNALYLYVNVSTPLAYTIPFRYFEHQEQINSFCTFINSKLQKTNDYQ